MQCIVVALFAVLAVASAGIVAPGFGYAAPYGFAAPYAAPYAAPFAASYAAHYAAPLAYAAPAVAAPVASGYVAATRGSVHVAPLPEGPFAVSHHINTAPAPGTF